MTEKSTNTPAEFQKLVEQFVQLANDMKKDGKPTDMVNAALMLASCTYATYTAAGNEGYLKSSGVNKITSIYRNQLSSLQEAKKQEIDTSVK